MAEFLFVVNCLCEKTMFILLIMQLASIADRTILEADKDEDGKISFEEFTRIMAKVDIEQRMSIRFLS